ncbi:MAG: ABC transporter permease [Bacteroides sp.]|nr:ABC transporter permease [Bacteroides sp.]
MAISAKHHIPVEWFLARRLRMKPAGGSASPGVIVAVAGIALSFIVMLASIAIVTGFKREITRRVIGFEQQITISPDASYGPERVNGGLRLTDSLSSVITSVVPSAELALVLDQPAVLKTDSDFQGIVLRGYSSGAADSAFIASNLIEGSMLSAIDSVNPLVISSQTASALQIGMGHRLYAHFFVGDNLLTRRLTVTGIYDTHFSEYDRIRAFTSLPLLQNLNKVDSLTGTAVAINGLRPEEIEDATIDLRVALSEYGTSLPTPEFFRIDNVYATGALYFNWLELLDTNVIVILILMACVSGFTLISSLLIIILERVRTIGLLKALGATDMLIRRVFILMAGRIVGLGLIVGNIVGLTVLLLQQSLHIIPLDPESYYLNFVPVHLTLPLVIMLNVAVALISFLLLILPSHMISTLSPSETMRYE